MNFKIDQTVYEIINIIENNNEEAYVVGGSIRDMIMGKTPKDWDLATSALPSQIVNFFRETSFKTIDLSQKHGTIVLSKEGESYEVTTFRTEEDYTDHRHPDEVKFVKKLEKDLQRRDFTMNALAYSQSKGLVDSFNGQEDIRNKIIKCVGKPSKRFNEDSLRILRGVRFSSQLNFEIEKNTYEAMKNKVHLIKFISMERIQNEFNKIILSDQPIKGILKLKEIGALELIIPEIKKTYDFDQHNPNHHLDVFQHSLEVLKHTPKELSLRLAAIFHDIGKPDTFFKDDSGIGHFYDHEKKSSEVAEKILRRMKYSNEIIEKTLIIINEHMTVYSEKFSDKAVKRLMNRIEPINIDQLVTFQIADIKATANPRKYEHVIALKNRVEAIKYRKEPLSIKDLSINGNDLIKLGVPEGKKIGNILNYLLEEVLENPELNNYRQLISLVNYYLKNADNHD
jgi:tRNA nucleotidyltransferase (CCA-adding enzyme)